MNHREKLQGGNTWGGKIHEGGRVKYSVGLQGGTTGRNYRGNLQRGDAEGKVQGGKYKGELHDGITGGNYGGELQGGDYSGELQKGYRWELQGGVTWVSYKGEVQREITKAWEGGCGNYSEGVITGGGRE